MLRNEAIVGLQGLMIHIKVMEAFWFALFPVLFSQDTITSIGSNTRAPIIPVADMSAAEYLDILFRQRVRSERCHSRMAK